MGKELQSAMRFFVQNLEAFIWITALLFFTVSPLPAGEHFTMCPLSLVGFQHCPGCGLGRSMILLLHGHIKESFNMHPLAVFALVLLVGRIIIGFRNYFRYQKQLSANT